MSFSSEQKDAIAAHNYKSSCCRRALLSGILFAKAYVEKNTVIFSLVKREFAEFAAKLIHEFYGKDTEIFHKSSGGRCISSSYESKSAAKYLREIEKNGELFTMKCAYCQSAFLRGVFLASGRISDPQKQYSLEFSLGARAERFKDYTVELGLSPRISLKKSETVVYFKNSNDIEDFYALAGMNPAMFAMIEAKFNGEARKNIMRVTNCETNNIQKAVNAAAKQTEIISELAEAKLLSSLPEELEETARLRLNYPDLSLAQLAAIATPSISKPGLSHRLKKIMELGIQLLHKEGD